MQKLKNIVCGGIKKYEGSLSYIFRTLWIHSGLLLWQYIKYGGEINMEGKIKIEGDMLVLNQNNISVDELVFMARLLGVIQDDE